MEQKLQFPEGFWWGAASGASQSYLVKFRSTFRTLLFLSLKEQGFSFFKMTFSEKDALLPYLFKLKL